MLQFGSLKMLLQSIVIIGSLICLTNAEQEEQPAGKVLSIFNVIKFKNDPCDSDGTKNGTCYTAEECEDRDGDSDGTCAGGFGVCCIFDLDCGESGSENITYMVQTSETTFTDAECVYEICKVHDNICRIRLDFTQFSIAGPAAGTALAGAAATSNNNAIGDCISDSFSVSGIGVPVICGTNTGQHIYYDATDTCHMITFHIGTGDTSTTRAWDIVATQYKCGDEDNGGPPGCLQYFTSNTGTIQSFNFPTGSTVGSGATHLSNQNYAMCIRRNFGMCYTCFYVAIAGGGTITDQASFGLSVSSIAGSANTGTVCAQDYLEFFDINTLAIASSSTLEIEAGRSTICGRAFNTINTATTSITLCTRRAPIRVRFTSDEDEVGPGTASINSEASMPPAGIIGFKLNYVQNSC